MSFAAGNTSVDVPRDALTMSGESIAIVRIQQQFCGACSWAPAPCVHRAAAPSISMRQSTGKRWVSLDKIIGSIHGPAYRRTEQQSDRLTDVGSQGLGGIGFVAPLPQAFLVQVRAQTIPTQSVSASGGGEYCELKPTLSVNLEVSVCVRLAKKKCRVLCPTILERRRQSRTGPQDVSARWGAGASSVARFIALHCAKIYRVQGEAW